ncbi:MAG: O-antigen ligase family protein, partial [Thermoanaerobaculum sp.]
WQRVVLAAGLGLVLVAPLVVDVATAGSFRTPKSVLANVLWAVLAAPCLARLSWDPWLLPPAAVAVAALVSALASTPAAAWAAVPWVMGALGFGALRQLSPDLRRYLAQAVLWAGLAQALVAMAFFDPRWRPESFRLLEPAEGRYLWLGTMGNPADVASFLVLPTVLAFAWFWTHKRHFLWLLVALLQTAVIVATQTLSALAALLAGLAALAFTTLSPARRLRVLGVLAIAAVVLVAAVSPIRQRVVSSWQEVKSGQWLWLASARGAAWSSALRMFLAHPIAGVGFGQFEAHSFRYLTANELAQRGRFLGFETGFGEAHNELLQYLAETGLLGLGLLLASVVFAVRARRRAAGANGKGLKASANPKGTGTAPWPKAPVLVSMVVLASFQFPLHLAAIAAQWAVVAALLLPPLPPPPGGRRLGAVLGLALSLLVAWGSFQQWRAYRAVQSAEVLVSLLRQRPRDGQRQTLAFSAYQGLNSRLRFLPFDYRSQTSAGNLAQEAGDLGKAVGHFRRALALAERPETCFNLGVALFALGQEHEAITHLVRAVELNPAVLKAVTDTTLARKLSAALEAEGYFSRFPWTRDWLST